MGAAARGISGHKSSGESQKSPTETPDSLISTAYAKVLDLISEGPIVGLVNGYQSIYLDKTPLANADGSLNYTGVTVGIRTGEADQEYLPGFPSVESETAVGVELKYATPWVQQITNVELSAVRIRLSVPYLTYTDSSGNINGYEVKYAIDVATDSGAYVEVLATSFNGKTTSTYERSHRIDLPASTTGWRVRVRRLTVDSTSSSIQSTTNIASYTEIIDAKLRYPYTAVVGITVDASQFSSIPARAFDCKLRIIRVPSNYTPETRSYSGVWDGTFKLAWTDNPAWIYYDLILNDRYGLGQLISAAQVDKWALYQIAGYCDEMVDDGQGGTEPRFTCNLYLQTRADALQVLQDLASIFRGMAYWAAGSVTASADMPSDPVYTYNQANVIDGKFTYVGSAKSTRFSVALVSWNDPSDFYNKKVEYVSDQKALARYGVQQTELTAFGCTSQGQAQRLGHYTLLTNLLENETVSFSVGMDGAIARPGQIVRVADEARAGRRIGGRIKTATANTVTLDADATIAAGDTIVIILPTGSAETRLVKSYANRVVTVTTPWTSQPVAQSVFAIETADLVPQVFRVLTVPENAGDEGLAYDITAVKHVASKFPAIDSGAQIVQLPVTVIPSSVQAPPADIQLSTYSSVDQGIAITTMRAEWVAPAGAVSYDVWWRRNSNDWVYAGRTYSASIEVRGIYSGTYLVRVAALNSMNTASIWGYSESTELQGKVGLPPAVTSLTATSQIFGIGLAWTFPAGSDDTQRTELWYSTTPSLDEATKLTDLAYPQADYAMQSLLAGATFFFWARLVDRTGNIGSFYPAGNGVMGQASTEAGPILELIAGQIDETALGQELKDRIDLIDGPPSLPGSVSDRLSELGTQVTEVTNQLQDQINAIGDIADSAAYNPDKAYTLGQSVLADDGKLYQAKGDVPVNTPPPNTTYWADVGQAVADANGLAARVTTTETRLTSVEGVNTSQASQIDGLQSSLNGKADASALNSLTTRVSSAEGTISSQGTALTGLNNSLTATNANVTAAQTAATNAATLAGSKGKVMVQTATPAAADQLAQNLWIDITGGANTPKRWNGSAWAAVTDKVATDAAAAAANALAVANTKADASTVSALTNTVTQQGTTITAQGTALTAVQASVAGMSPDNLINDPAFANAADTVSSSSSVFDRTSSSAPANGPTARLLRVPFSSATTNSYVSFWTVPQVRALVGTYAEAMPCKPGEVYTFSMWVFTEGTTGRAVQPYINLFVDNTSNTSPLALSGANTVADGAWTKISYQFTIPAGYYYMLIRIRYRAGDAVVAWVSDPRLNKQSDEDAAQASATSALDGRVTQTEAGLTSQGSQLTSLTNSVAGKADNSALQALASTVSQQGSTLDSQGTAVTQLQSTIGGIGGAGTNLLPDDYSWLTSTTLPATVVNTLTRLGVAVAAAASGFGIKMTLGSAVTTQYLMLAPSNNAAGYNIDMEAGSYLVSMYVQGSAAGSMRVSMYSGTHRYSANVAFTTTRQRLVFVCTATAAARAAITIYPNMAGLAAGTEIVIDSVMIEEQIGTGTAPSAFVAGPSARAIAAQATALSTLDTRVTQTETSITAQATRLDGLYVQVNPATAGDSTGYAGSSAMFAGVWSEQSARIEDGVATSQRIDTVQASVTDTTNALAVTNATVQQTSQAVATLDGKASASWSVKLQVNASGQYVMAGIGVGIENTGAGLQGQVLVSADRFAIVGTLAGGTSYTPFVVQGGQVFINSAFIQDGTITNAMIGAYLQSTDYVAGSTGWRLDKAGTFEINGNVAGQGRMAITNRAVKVYDGSGVLRVQLGDLSA
ncbi:phage tail protein [Pseudomonas eucalypticola]|uniref:Phage tail protein n=1 Tax=Pseudomonas eucalypticola TaxID=2599595 RepID=A0A7D5D944_9PSED|nr:phage tail protein [Pseudomonas eucalypticola]QKZ05817.1 phage tail protein [Pseudomonas eucalypticola]